MTIPSLEVLENGTLADVTPLNTNFERLRVGVNTNESSINNLNTNLQDLSTEVESISAIVMPDLTYEKLSSQFLVAKNKNTLTIKAGTTIRLDVSSDDVRYLEVKEDTDYNIYDIMDSGVASLTAGKDYYIYLVAKDVTDSATSEITKTVELKASINSTYPTGYNANNSRKIGGFHTLCLGITSSNAPAQLDGTTHALIGFNAGDIVAETVWCLSNRPQSTPEGMFFDDLTDLWWDCYPVSGNDGDPTSVYGATRTHTITYQALMGRLGKLKKRFPTYEEFMIAAKGGNERTNVYGSVQPNPDITGGHVDTAGKAMVNPKGGWEFSGIEWQFVQSVSGDGGSGFSTTDGSGAQGQTYGTARILSAGGGWNDSSSCGSRALHATYVLSHADAPIGGRAVSLPLRV